MAAHYVAEISALQTEEPCFLGGFSFGGIVAFEMAQQLHAQGRPADCWPCWIRTTGANWIVSHALSPWHDGYA